MEIPKSTTRIDEGQIGEIRWQELAQHLETQLLRLGGEPLHPFGGFAMRGQRIQIEAGVVESRHRLNRLR
jgi:hypothetical protein